MLVVNILDIIGTSAFTVSGVLVGIKNRLDLFGVFVLAVFTASGGGLIRDIIISEELPLFFSKPRYFITIFISAVLAYMVLPLMNRLSMPINVSDAAGLGVFTVLATYRAMLLEVPVIGVVFIAVVAGVGGGIIRDILVNDVPLIFKREIYAIASIVGALNFYFFYGNIPLSINIYISILLVFMIRMVSVYFNLHLPIIGISNKEEGGNHKNGN